MRLFVPQVLKVFDRLSQYAPRLPIVGDVAVLVFPECSWTEGMFLLKRQQSPSHHLLTTTRICALQGSSYTSLQGIWKYVQLG